MTDESSNLPAPIEEQPTQPEAAQPSTPLAGDSQRTLRAELAEQIAPFTRDRQSALAVLERLDRALWATALRGSESAELAKVAYETGAQQFLRPPQY